MQVQETASELQLRLTVLSRPMLGAR